MFGIGMTELGVILVIALLIFGPNKLPELARSLGKGFGEFRRASYDLRQSLMEATELDPPEDATASRQTPPAAAAKPDQADPPPPPPAEPATEPDPQPSDGPTEGKA